MHVFWHTTKYNFTKRWKPPLFKHYICNMLELVNSYLHRALSDTSKPKLLLACSGGVDSMVLADLLRQLPWAFGIAHVNFELRGQDSKGDQAFVSAWGESHGVSVHHHCCDANQWATSHKVSIQMAARNIRYAFFDQLKTEEGYTHVLTAHHADDQLETFFINAGRGTGLKGLCGIPDDRYLRPLLSVHKQALLAYAKEHTISWREDASNAKTYYLRNAIRHELIPLWQKIDPQGTDNLLRTLTHLKEAQQALAEQLQVFQDSLFKVKESTVHIAVLALKALPSPNYFLHALFSPYGFGHIKDLKALLEAQAGKQLLSKTHRLLRDREELLLTPLTKSVKEEIFSWNPSQPLHYPLKMEVVASGALSSNIACINPSRLKFPLIVRRFRKGDYFYPYGMKGKKKLAKFFKDEKYSLIEKENQWLLCSEDAIVWVIGRRIDARFAAALNDPNKIIVACQ